MMKANRNLVLRYTMLDLSLLLFMILKYISLVISSSLNLIENRNLEDK